MTNETLWWISLGLGLVVSLVAVALLQTLLAKIRRIERGADAVWEAGKTVARNTATTWMLGQTRREISQLTEEAVKHDDFLNIVLQKTGK